MKTILLLLVILISMLSISSCYYDKEQLLYGNTIDTACSDTAGAVSYAVKVIPLFQQYCYGCHSGNFPSGSISMGTYSTDKAIGQNGKLYGSISHASGFSAMPKSAAKMSACQITIIKKWIDSGMLNN